VYLINLTYIKAKSLEVMKLSEFKTILSDKMFIEFQLESGEKVPTHFHVTEVGVISKHFIDCGGTERKENVVNFQLWYSDDYDHRLSAEKLNHIIALSEKQLRIDDSLEIEVEYQSDTIGKFGIAHKDGIFVLTSKQTACLAEDACGVDSPKVSLSVLGGGSCDPNSGCC